MKEILGEAKTIRALLKGVKYSIDFYQREYKWQSKQIQELIDDLTNKFQEEFDPGHARNKVAEYPHYFLGSIIISKKDGARYIVDGQQRLTSLTLLLIYLRHLQGKREDQVNVDELILSEKYGQKSFNLHVDERLPCMEALFEGDGFDYDASPESVQNLLLRYRDIEDVFPDELQGPALPFFVDWLLENVHLVEITAYSDDDAYTIFETMNDRGLSLSPTDMLKGYLLANIDDTTKRANANSRWRERIRELMEVGKDVDADFFKTWFRSQYSSKIRERKKGASPEDFDRIGTEFHRWLREVSGSIGLKSSDDFSRLINRDFDFYSKYYLKLFVASQEPVGGLEAVLYNSEQGFTLQYLPLLAVIKPEDNEKLALMKLELVARFVDILISRRIWNSRSISYSTMQYAIFLAMKDIRRLEPVLLAQHLHKILKEQEETFAKTDRLRLNQQNRYVLHRLLARMTDYVETASGLPSRYLEFVAEGKNRYEVEHIWADHPERHTDEFKHPADFADHRNRIGGLLLLPKSFNGSYGDLTYEKKLPHYYGQNLLARSLNSKCYEHNPGFLRFTSLSGLPFKSYEHFQKAEIEERENLYRLLAERIWNPDDLLRDLAT
jgi:uncharacterized protein with ParB-like and HNH nuclease domain